MNKTENEQSELISVFSYCQSKFLAVTPVEITFHASDTSFFLLHLMYSFKKRLQKCVYSVRRSSKSCSWIGDCYKLEVRSSEAVYSVSGSNGKKERSIQVLFHSFIQVAGLHKCKSLCTTSLFRKTARVCCNTSSESNPTASMAPLCSSGPYWYHNRNNWKCHPTQQ